jgi:hypothetical protein
MGCPFFIAVTSSFAKSAFHCTLPPSLIPPHSNHPNLAWVSAMLVWNSRPRLF